MASELNVLAHMLDRIGESNRKSRDFTLDSLRDVHHRSRRLLPGLPHLRRRATAGRPRTARRRAGDRARAPPQPGDGVVALRLLPRGRAAARSDGSATGRPGERRDGYPPADADEARERLRFAMKLQQYTGPVRPRGSRTRRSIATTCCCRSTRSAAIRRASAARVESSTTQRASGAQRLAVRDARDRDARHQARRGRARAHQRALGDAGRLGARGVASGCASTERTATIVDGEPAPDRNDEYRFYQALLGAGRRPPGERLPRGARGLRRAPRRPTCSRRSRKPSVIPAGSTANEAYEDALDRVRRARPRPGRRRAGSCPRSCRSSTTDRRRSAWSTRWRRSC